MCKRHRFTATMSIRVCFTRPVFSDLIFFLAPIILWLLWSETKTKTKKLFDQTVEMVSQIISCLSKSSSLLCISDSRRLIPPKTYNRGGLNRFSPKFANRRLSTVTRRKWRYASIFNSGKESGGEGKVGSTVSDTSCLASGKSSTIFYF